MALINFNIGKARQKLNATRKLNKVISGLEDNLDTDVNKSLYESACLRIISSACSRARLCAYKKVGNNVEEVPDAEILEILANPFINKTGKDFIASFGSTISKYGRFFCIIDEVNGFKYIQVLDPEELQLKWNRGIIQEAKYGESETLLNIDNLVYSFDKTENNSDWTETSEDFVPASKRNERLNDIFLAEVGARDALISAQENSINLSGIFTLTSTGKLFDSVVSGIKSKFQGTANTKQPLFSNGKLEYTPISVSDTIAQTTAEVLAQCLKDITLYYSVPESLLATTPVSTIYSSKQVINNFYDIIIRGKLDLIIEMINLMIKPLVTTQEDIYVDYVLTNPVDQSEIDQTILDLRSSNDVTRNEVRGVANLVPVEGGDEIEKSTSEEVIKKVKVGVTRTITKERFDELKPRDLDFENFIKQMKDKTVSSKREYKVDKKDK